MITIEFIILTYIAFYLSLCLINYMFGNDLKNALGLELFIYSPILCLLFLFVIAHNPKIIARDVEF